MCSKTAPPVLWNIYLHLHLHLFMFNWSTVGTQWAMRYIITIYRSPTRNFQYFTDNLEKIFSVIYSNNTEIIKCGDININYLIDSSHKQLASYSLCSTVQFPTRIQNNSHSAIDNIFINTLKFSDFSLFPIINRPPDHNAQRIIICNIFEQNSNTYFCFNRRIDKSSITDFNTKLSYEVWEDIFAENDVNTIFNNFLNTYLRIFYSSFPLKKVHHKSCNKAWLTPGIKISCVNKRKLFLFQRNRNDPQLTTHYKRYCKTLTSVIKLAKKGTITAF
jgi:hypothetical protein